LLNQRDPEFHGAANSLYGPRGPQRAARDYNRKLSGPPESIGEYVSQAIRKVPGLNPRQRLALHNVMTALSRDIGFIRMVASQAHHMGPHSEAATHMDSQGNVITG
jgi:hypothetical protein